MMLMSPLAKGASTPTAPRSERSRLGSDVFAQRDVPLCRLVIEAPPTVRAGGQRLHAHVSCHQSPAGAMDLLMLILLSELEGLQPF